MNTLASNTGIKYRVPGVSKRGSSPMVWLRLSDAPRLSTSPREDRFLLGAAPWPLGLFGPADHSPCLHLPDVKGEKHHSCSFWALFCFHLARVKVTQLRKPLASRGSSSPLGPGHGGHRRELWLRCSFHRAALLAHPSPAPLSPPFS